MDAAVRPGSGKPDFAAIDWTAPWFSPWAARGTRWQQAALAGEAALLDTMNADADDARLITTGGSRLSFVPQSALPIDSSYGRHIARTGCVPTRYNLHDFFNGLSWFQFPQIKLALNALGFAAIDSRDSGSASMRGGVGDALTHFDENAVLFASADPALSAALRSFDWRTLFVTSRDAWTARCEVRCFGHALLEKLMTPFNACTAHAWIVDVPPDYFAWPDDARDARLDCTVSEALSAGELSGSRAFAPLPVLGIPGWWPANRDPSFYDDVSVFRRGRRERSLDARIATSKVGQAVAALPASAGKGEESPDSNGQGDG